MRILKAILIPVLLGIAIVTAMGCGSDSEGEATTEQQVVTVIRGDLSIEVLSSGNLLYSTQEELAFEIAGTVGEVLVETGDLVEEGQVLANIDVDEWQTHLDTLEKAITSAESSLVKAERNLVTSQSSLLQAETNLLTAQRNLEELDPEKIAQDAITAATAAISSAQQRLLAAYEPNAHPGAAEFWAKQKDLAERELDRIMADPYAGVAEARADLEYQVDLMEVRLTETQNSVVDAEEAIEDAKQAVADANQGLEEALAVSTVITAPCAGIITSVNMEPSDEVGKGYPVLAIIDPNKFKVDILVSEMDIFDIQEGAAAIVQVDSLSGLNLPATVTYIAPTAAIQSGVVNYEVTVELDSFDSLSQMMESVPAMGEQSQETLEYIDAILNQAVSEGRITREQADTLKERLAQMPFEISEEMVDQMIERSAQGGGLGPMDGNLTEGQFGQFFEGLPEGFPEELLDELPAQAGQDIISGRQLQGSLLGSIELREGLTVTVSIIVEEASDVILVPSGAVTTMGRQSYVSVMLADSTTEQRAVNTGISDGQYTQVTDGLSEGEEVVVLRSTGTSSTSDIQQGPGGSIMIPGMGGFGR